MAGLKIMYGEREGGTRSGVLERSPGGGLEAKRPEADDFENNYRKHHLRRPLH